jgi:hypothetical protein
MRAERIAIKGEQNEMKREKNELAPESKRDLIVEEVEGAKLKQRSWRIPKQPSGMVTGGTMSQP